MGVGPGLVGQEKLGVRRDRGNGAAGGRGEYLIEGSVTVRVRVRVRVRLRARARLRAGLRVREGLGLDDIEEIER